MTIIKYKTYFHVLSRYATTSNSTNPKRIRKFVKSLIGDSIGDSLVCGFKWFFLKYHKAC